MGVEKAGLIVMILIASGASPSPKFALLDSEKLQIIDDWVTERRWMIVGGGMVQVIKVWQGGLARPQR